jgi:hypothetical protein
MAKGRAARALLDDGVLPDCSADELNDIALGSVELVCDRLSTRIMDEAAACTLRNLVRGVGLVAMRSPMLAGAMLVRASINGPSWTTEALRQLVNGNDLPESAVIKAKLSGIDTVRFDRRAGFASDPG